MTDLDQLVAALDRDGYEFGPAEDTGPLLAAFGPPGVLNDWAGFAASWNDLGVDTYMADGGRYRRRRFAVFAAGPDGIRRKPHQPHYQSRDYNTLNGGIARWFEPVSAPIAAHPVLQSVLLTCKTVFERLCEVRDWHVEIHQFRIEAKPGEPGQPSPEGMHRDGVDYVLVLLIDRINIASGVTSIHGPDHTRLGSFTLARPLDAAWVDDGRVFHGVTAVAPLDPSLPAHRDVLVVTFRRS